MSQPQTSPPVSNSNGGVKQLNATGNWPFDCANDAIGSADALQSTEFTGAGAHLPKTLVERPFRWRFTRIDQYDAPRPAISDQNEPFADGHAGR